MIKKFSAMILAAGYGRRMMPLTEKIPKPLVEVNNVPLLKNTIEFLFDIGCNKIVINIHYKHQMVVDFINKFFKYSNIVFSYEKKILGTGGGVKNAVNLFEDNNILITNSDIYWKKENLNDVKRLISGFSSNDFCKLLLVDKEKSFGIRKNSGDFTLKQNKVTRWKNGEKVIYYSGLQMVFLDIFKNIKTNKFSFNDIWDLQIQNKTLNGIKMNSDLYHVGDINGLNQAINSNS